MVNRRIQVSIDHWKYYVKCLFQGICQGGMCPITPVNQKIVIEKFADFH